MIYAKIFVLLAVLYGLYCIWDSGVTYGVNKERVVWQEIDRHELEVKNNAIYEQAEKIRELEVIRSQAAAKHDKDLVDAIEKEKIRHAASLRALNDSYQLQLFQKDGSVYSGGEHSGDITACISSYDGTEGSKLSPTTRSDLRVLVHDANRNTLQLQACQRQVKSDRELKKNDDSETE
jgi:hypothetical protein